MSTTFNHSETENTEKQIKRERTFVPYKTKIPPLNDLLGIIFPRLKIQESWSNRTTYAHCYDSKVESSVPATS